MIAILLAAIALASAHSHPVLWVCYPGKTPTSPAPSNCQRVSYRIVWKATAP